ncbi:MAG: replicative DNA helicase, partial [Bacteroidales bacterium]|nr:replicative DNA helicase [Bacteroidales bacterium]
GVMDVLSPACFYKEIHQKIFRTIVELSTKLEPIDILTVTQSLRKNGILDEVGGPFYITQLTNRVASAAHIEFHARIIAQKHIQRELIRISTEIQNRAFDESIDVYDLLNFSEDELFKVAEGNIKKETTKIGVLINEAIKQIEEASKREDGLSGVPCGFTAIDRITSGWQKSDLVIIAARPSMGKTAFVLSMARNMSVEHKRAVAVFSLEMAAVQLVNRLIIGETGISGEKIKNGRLANYEWEQLEYQIKGLSEAPIYIDDTPAISIFELRAKCRRLKMQYDIEVVIIDYLQLMTAGGDGKGNREQEVSTISRSLKAIAKELNIAIIALSQLNRSVETRGGNKRPQLSDLRESGAIEQDADMVLFIHRPEYYGFDNDEDGNSLLGIAEIIIAKHRNGATGDVQLKFIKEQAKFAELEADMIISPAAGLTLSSKMNVEDDFTNNDLGANKSFESMDGDDAPF